MSEDVSPLPADHPFTKLIERLRAHHASADTPERRELLKDATTNVVRKLDEARVNRQGKMVQELRGNINAYDPATNAIDDALELLGRVTGGRRGPFAFIPGSRDTDPRPQYAPVYDREFAEITKVVDAAFEEALRDPRKGPRW